MQYFLGIDIGTTSSKAAAISACGEVLADHSVSYPMIYPEAGWCEQDPQEIFDAVVESINEVVTAMQPHELVFVAFSSAMHSLILMDANGKALTNCIIWADNRSEEIANALRNSQAGMDFYNQSGVPVHSMSPLCKMLWFQQFRPQLYSQTAKFIGIKEFVLFHLCGVYVVDTSLASATGLLNIHTLLWNDGIVKYLNITKDQLPQVKQPQDVIKYPALLNNVLLPQHTPIVLGGSDGAMANLGTGAIRPGQIAITIGTSGAARMLVNGPELDTAMRTFCYHVAGNQYIMGGATNNGAVVLQWLKESLLKTDIEYETLFAEAETVAPGCDGLLFLPYILGERAPIWNAAARGVFFGLSIGHKREHLVRAVMEAVIFAVYSITEIVMVKKNVTEIHASGGFARSTLWLQILADVSNTTVVVKENIDSPLLGAVLIGAEALQFKVSLSNTTAATYYPRQEKHLLYQKIFKQFENLYFLLKSQMD